MSVPSTMVILAVVHAHPRQTARYPEEQGFRYALASIQHLPALAYWQDEAAHCFQREMGENCTIHA